MWAKCWSEWQDLNLRPPRPERGAPQAAELMDEELIAIIAGASSQLREVGQVTLLSILPS